MTLVDASSRLWAAAMVVACYALLCAWIAYREWGKRGAAAQAAASLVPATSDAPRWLVAFATQTGFAEQLAWQTARLLHTAGASARIASLRDLRAEDLAGGERVLFVVSTYGEGDQPDQAASFASTLMSRSLALDGLHYAVLALGDRAYAHFCGFGRRMDDWLRSCGAQRLMNRIEVDNGDARALRQWREALAHLLGSDDVPEWQVSEYHAWRVAARTCLNPGGAGLPCFHVELEPADGAMPAWQAGDLVQVRIPTEPRPREYTIASLPADGRVHLLIRQERRDDGSFGAASGWLTEHTPLGGAVELRLRSHSNFHLGDNAARPLILIGNGTGLAGLRSHLKARAALKQGRNWLIFGERNRAHDFYYRNEIEAWLARGLLTRMDLAFSRDQPDKRYVQDCLREADLAVREWISVGAAIYVCGSLQGMAGGVEQALRDIIGVRELERLLEAGRYRRDVY